MASFHWFTQAAGVSYDEVKKSEQPDFLMKIGDKQIGVEITRARRTLDGGKYPAQQIEAAQTQFAQQLYEQVQPVLPLEIWLCLNDEVAVDVPAAQQALKAIVPAIEKASQGIANPFAGLLVRSPDDMPNSGHHKIVCPELPAFLQHIQLLHVGQNETRVIGGRGGLMLPFKDDDLAVILKDKHKKLQAYQACDEHWLVIVSGQVPPIVLPEALPLVWLPSMATNVGNVELTLPIQSDFDLVYFFKSPADVITLTA